MDISELTVKIKSSKAIIFDMDGVLVDTTKAHAEAFDKTLKEISKFFDYSKYTGMSTEETFEKFFSKELIERLSKMKRDNVSENISGLNMFENAENLLRLIKNKDIKLGLCTSASSERTTKILSKFKIYQLFDLIITKEDVSRGKPDPEIYLKALSTLKVSPSEAIVIEDAKNGIESSKRAKIFTIGLAHTHTEEELLACDYILKDMSSLYSIFSYVLNSYKSFESKSENKAFTVISAAGRGTRLNFDGPKILYKILGVTCLERIYEKVKSISRRMIVVVNAESELKIKEFIKNKGLPIEVVVAHNTKGTADSVYVGLSAIKEEGEAIIIWGDQLGIKKNSIKELLISHNVSKSDFSFASIIKQNPYIHMVRDNNGKIIKVLRKKLDDKMPEYGENDAGLFISDVRKLKETIEDMSKNRNGSTIKDGEFDFLEIIPLLSKNSKVTGVNCITEEETLGLNTVEEAKQHEKLLLIDS